MMKKKKPQLAKETWDKLIFMFFVIEFANETFLRSPQKTKVSYLQSPKKMPYGVMRSRPLIIKVMERCSACLRLIVLYASAGA